MGYIATKLEQLPHMSVYQRNKLLKTSELYNAGIIRIVTRAIALTYEKEKLERLRFKVGYLYDANTLLRTDMVNGRQILEVTQIMAYRLAAERITAIEAELSYLIERVEFDGIQADTQP